MKYLYLEKFAPFFTESTPSLSQVYVWISSFM